MKVFLSTPITQALDPETGRLRTRTAIRISRISEVLREAGHDVFLAIDREQWGEALMGPEQCAKLDFDGVVESDHVVAVFGDTPSEGLVMELGWASARQRPITLLADHNVSYSPLILGLPTVCDTALYRINWSDDDASWRIPLQLRGLLPSLS